MKTRTMIVLVAAAVALSSALTAIVTPRAVNAAIATLVRDQDNAARHPFTTYCQTFVKRDFFVSCSTPSIPLGEEVVIETVGFHVTGDLSNTQVVTNVLAAASGIVVESPNSVVDNGVLQPRQSFFTATQQVRLYADPGSSILCTAQTKLTNPTFGMFAQCSISGYSVSLP